MIEEFVSRGFALRDAAHRAHWAATGVGSYAKHVTLGEFYDGLIDRIDTIVETYQGGFDIIGEAKTRSYSRDDIVSRIGDEGKWVAKNRDAIANGNCALENLLDDLIGFYMQTFYKLTKLR